MLFGICARRLNPVRAMSRVSPPASVQGMTQLRRDSFDTTCKLTRLQVQSKDVDQVLTLVKNRLFKIPKFKPVVTKGDVTVLFLDGGQEGVEGLGVVDEVDVRLGYDNFKADQVLRAVIPEGLDSVTSYTLVGHIVHLNLRPELDPYKALIGQVLLDKVPQAQTVITKSDSIHSEFRFFEYELLAGENNLVTTVKQNKVQFQMDFSKVYWNSRLSTEHERILNCIRPGDYLFDVFAGIGPFSVPAAKKGAHVFANDLNPDSYHWLGHNLTLNKTQAKIYNLDAADFIRTVVKPEIQSLSPGNYDIHITMNLPSLAHTFLPHFMSLFDDPAVALLPQPWIHLYCFIKDSNEPIKDAVNLVETILGAGDELDAHFVRNVAPNKDMMRVDLRLTPRISLSRKRKKVEE